MPRRLFALTLLAFAAGCGSAPERPYVLLVSIDGFRHDYPELHGAPNLLRMAQQGIRAKGLMPSYRTNTFPNHLSIITGLYPEHHGIVDNNFFDPRRKQTYLYKDKATAGDGSWYRGTPLWVLAEKQGLRTASFFWPGSDVEIQGARPGKYFNYDGSVPSARRVQQVIDWFRLPKDERPHFVTLYFDAVDTAGHDFGPLAAETRKAVSDIDGLIGTLMSGLRETGIAVNVIVVSDHGMIQVDRESISLGAAEEFKGFEIAPAAGSQVMLYSDDAKLVSRTFARLNGRDPRYRVYRRDQTPEYLHYRNNPRIGDLVIMAAAPVSLHIGASAQSPDPGAHGYDPWVFQDMNGIFFAQGPNLKQGVTVDAFDNVHIYPLIAHILGLTPPEDIDGSLDALREVLR
jgi:predicted AlkP superfamily pyrophosphatase or phosphodiesterase